MKEARLLRQAEQDLDQAISRYNEAAADLGYAFAAEVKRTLSGLMRFLESAPVVSERIRRAGLKRFPYSIFYAILRDEIVVLSIGHHKRRPGHWKGRAMDFPKP